MEMGVKRWMVGIAACVLSYGVEAQGFYTKAGVLGAGLGYFHGVSDYVSLRLEAMTASKFKHTFRAGASDYKASLNADQAGVYADFFPLGNGLRFSGGMQVRKLRAVAYASPDDHSKIARMIKRLGANAGLIGDIKFPSLAPYVGLGWGYHDSQKPGFGFVLDLGLAFGKPSVGLRLSDHIMGKTEGTTRFGAMLAKEEQAAVEVQRQKLADKLEKFAVFPHVYAGISYRF